MQTNDLAIQLEAANTAYRNGNPIMSDAEYDALEEQLRLLDPEHPFLKQLADEEYERTGRDENDPVEKLITLGHDQWADFSADESSFNREERLTLAMGSQQKALSLDDPNLGKYLRETEEEEYNYSDKVDGMSSEITYVNGQLTRAMTRGDGKIGVNVTLIARQIPGLPKTVPHEGTLVVRGEICMMKSKLPLVNAELAAEGRDPMANTRNGTVAIVKHLKNAHLAKHLDFLAFNMESRP